jgi:7,8-dihydropterin-6-yl-methyl-4-(beta-D-ribofuranosyl)aminobenzene 5'-phosphate synthase
MVADTVRTTIVYDNRCVSEDLASDWGFACVVSRGSDRLLFDTGARGGILEANLAALGLDTSGFDRVVISHDHWDHNGGLEAALGDCRGRCWIPSSASAELAERVRACGAEPVRVSEQQELMPGIWTTGEIRGEPSEQALVVETADGPVVLTGCAHPGVAKMCRVVKRQFGAAPVLVVGGFHLGGADPGQLASVSDELRETGVARVGPAHCTGEEAIAFFEAEWGSGFERVGCGWTMSWEAR